MSNSRITWSANFHLHASAWVRGKLKSFGSRFCLSNMIDREIAFTFTKPAHLKFEVLLLNYRTIRAISRRPRDAFLYALLHLLCTYRSRTGIWSAFGNRLINFKMNFDTQLHVADIITCIKFCQCGSGITDTRYSQYCRFPLSGQQQPGPLSFFELELNLVVALSQSADQTFGTASLST